MESSDSTDLMLIEFAKTLKNLLKDVNNNSSKFEQFFNLCLSSNIFNVFSEKNKETKLKNLILKKWYYSKFLYILSSSSLKRIHPTIINTQVSLLCITDSKTPKKLISLYKTIVNKYFNDKFEENLLEPFSVNIFEVSENALKEYDLDSIEFQLKTKLSIQTLTKNLSHLMFELIENSYIRKNDEKSIIDMLLKILKYGDLNHKVDMIDLLNKYFQNKHFVKFDHISQTFENYFILAEKFIIDVENKNQKCIQTINQFLQLLNVYKHYPDYNFNVKQIKLCEILIKNDNFKITCLILLKNVFKSNISYLNILNTNDNIFSIKNYDDLFILKLEFYIKNIFMNNDEKMIQLLQSQINNLLKENIEPKLNVQLLRRLLIMFKCIKIDLNINFNYLNESILSDLLNQTIHPKSVGFNEICEIFCLLLNLQDFFKCKELLEIFTLIFYPYVELIGESPIDKTTYEKLKKTFRVEDKGQMEKTCLNCIMTILKYARIELVRCWMVKICEYARTDKDKYLIVLENIPILMYHGIDELHHILANFLCPLLKTQQYPDQVSKIFLKVICLLNGRCFCVNYYNFNVDGVQFSNEIICYDCHKLSLNQDSFLLKKLLDNSKTIGNIYFVNDDYLIRLEDNDFTNRKNYFDKMENILMPFLISFNTGLDSIIKLNLTRSLVYLSRHVKKFYDISFVDKWICFVFDDDVNVRKTFVQVFDRVLCNLENDDCIKLELKESIYKKCLQNIVDLTQSSLNVTNEALQETTLHCVEILARFNVDNSLVTCLRLIIYYLILNQSAVKFQASTVFSNIACKLNVSSNELYVNYKKFLCKSIADCIMINFFNDKHQLKDNELSKNSSLKNKLYSSLDVIATTFSYENPRDYLLKDEHHLVPYLITYCVQAPQVKYVFEIIAHIIFDDYNDLLIRNFQNIYPDIFIYENDDMLKNCLRFIESTTNTSFTILIKSNVRVLINQFLLYYHQSPQRVCDGITFISQLDTDQNSNGNNILQNYLKSRFLQALVFFDSKLLCQYVALSIKRKILESLADIIKLMGKENVTSLRFRLIATLYSTLTLKDIKTRTFNGYNEHTFTKYSCLAWNAFVETCSIEHLGPLLSTIFISLAPVQKHYPQIVNGIFKYLLIKNENNLKHHISDLFFIDELKLTNSKDIETVVNKYLNENYGNLNVCERIQFYLKYCSHENVDVKIYAVKYLIRLLKTNRKQLNDLILCNNQNGMHSVIVEMIDLIVNCCHDNNQLLKLISGECIGELGAIEPSHLPRRYKKTNEDFIFYVTDQNFVINAINELTRAFQSEKYSNNINGFAFTLQEVIKIFNLSPKISDSQEGKKIWDSLSESQKQLLTPLLSSRYMMLEDKTYFKGSPIFNSLGDDQKFEDWLYIWSNQMIQFLNLLTDPNVEKISRLFTYCRPSMKIDIKTLLYFLPHILVNCILFVDNQHLNQIYNEMITVIDFDKKVYLNKGMLRMKKYQSKLMKNNSIQLISNSLSDTKDSLKIKASKMVYILLDYLNRWLWQWQRVNCPEKSTNNDKNYQKILNFLNRFNKLTVAKSNYINEEYSRALIYLEDFIDQNNDEFMKQLGFFIRIYAQLEDADSVAGVRAIQQTEPSLEESVLTHEISGQLQNASACYDRMAQEGHLEPHILQGMIRCYLDLDNPFTALSLAEGFVQNQPECDLLMYELQAESLWRLGQYDQLSNLISKEEIQNSDHWGVRIGHALLDLRSSNHLSFMEKINTTRMDIIQNFSAFSMEEGAYQHAYPQIVKLHIINELERVENLVNEIVTNETNESCESLINSLVNEWDLRAKIIQTKTRIIEPILCLRRITLQQTKDLLKSNTNITELIDKHIGKLWLKSAIVARDSGMNQQGYVYLLNAEQYKLKELFVEKAKFHWNCGEQELALTTLKRGIDEHFSSQLKITTNDKVVLSESISQEDRLLCAEAKLLIARYNDEVANLDMEINLGKYKEVISCYQEWEDGNVYLARYYEKIFSVYRGDKDVGQGGDIQTLILNYYGKSLTFGCRYIYQSMPRMLSIWLDFGTRLLQSTENVAPKQDTLEKMTRLINKFLEVLPSYMFLTAFSQIVSRICHPHNDVYQQLKNILVTLILNHPQHSLWNIMSVCKSSYPIRTKRCQEILQNYKIRQNSEISLLIFDINRVAEKLIELCNKGIGDQMSTTTVSNLVQSLPRLLSSKELSQIMMPVQKFRKMILPSDGASLSQHVPFPSRLVYIAGIDEQVHIMPSLQRPRRITLIGSDGKKYIHMLKPKDDLRKDFRLMEFNDVVNQYLHMDSEARERRLYIRTYSVVPLNEECGLIEWVNNLVGLRPILINIYKKRGIHLTNKEMKALMCNVKDSLEKKRKVFLEQLLPKHPPVFHEWFRSNFSDPHAWYQARLAYIRTTAVISMVGYILGLGDRHGENILFDSINGDTVHVDFNCLFNKGETFEWPERVPFRLTHNMVKAMGPLGYEGGFRISCEITLRILRAQRETLMSIVKPFVYDPLVSWPKTNIIKGNTSTTEKTNQQAYEHIKNIESRLQGIKIGKRLSLCLSVEGHVNSLIQDATSIDNLCQMYLGWGPQL